MRVTRKPWDVVRGLRRIVLAALIGVMLPGVADRPQAQTPEEAARLFETLELKPGMTVGEIGAGRGEMTVELAKRLTSNGHVYSTELDPARLADIRAAVSRAELANVTVIDAADRTTNLPASCCDAVFMRDVYHHIKYPDDIARSISAALKPGGRLAVIDFEPSPGSALPDGVPANRGGHGVGPAVIAGEMKGAGLAQVNTISDWLNDVPRKRLMFLVLFKKSQQ